jgi:short-subunit dehydrogenase
MRNVNGNNADKAKKLSDFAKSHDLKMNILNIDVASDESVKAATTALPLKDVLINNAGLKYGGPLEAYTSEACMAQLNLNIVGVLRMAKGLQNQPKPCLKMKMHRPTP